jgi:hypothetical protein
MCISGTLMQYDAEIQHCSALTLLLISKLSSSCRWDSSVKLEDIWDKGKLICVILKNRFSGTNYQNDITPDIQAEYKH